MYLSKYSMEQHVSHPSKVYTAMFLTTRSYQNIQCQVYIATIYMPEYTWQLCNFIQTKYNTDSRTGCVIIMLKLVLSMLTVRLVTGPQSETDGSQHNVWYSYDLFIIGQCVSIIIRSHDAFLWTSICSLIDFFSTDTMQPWFHSPHWHRLHHILLMAIATGLKHLDTPEVR